MKNRIFIQFQVDDFSITNRENQNITSDNRNFIFARFHFSPSWNNLNKVAIFTKNGFQPITDPIVDGICKIPNELMADIGPINISVFAGDRRTVNTAIIEIIQSGFKEGIPPLDPEPSALYVQTPDSSVPFIRFAQDSFEFFANGIWQKITADGGGAVGTAGYNGWTPVFSLISDNDKAVIRITDWIGGGGQKPAVGYLGPTGIVANIAFATDIRGKQGAQGQPGEAGSQGLPGPQGPQGPPGENFDPADVLRIDKLEVGLSATQAESTAKWIILNDVDNRSRANAANIAELQAGQGTHGIALYEGTAESPVIMSELPLGFCGIVGDVRNNPAGASYVFADIFWGNIDRDDTYTYFVSLNKREWRVYSFRNSGALAHTVILGNISNMLTTNTAQTIAAIKTFTALPVSSIVPTQETQFVNKAYVDSMFSALLDRYSLSLKNDTVPQTQLIDNGINGLIESAMADLNLSMELYDKSNNYQE